MSDWFPTSPQRQQGLPLLALPAGRYGAVELFLFNQFGDLERVMLRRGNQPSAKFWRRSCCRSSHAIGVGTSPKYFRGDSAFALPKPLRLLVKEGVRYAIRRMSPTCR